MLTDTYLASLYQATKTLQNLFESNKYSTNGKLLISRDY